MKFKMKIKSEKGITLITLMLTIAILIIISYVAVRISIGISQVAEFENVKTYMLLIKSKCEILINEKAIGEREESYYGTLQNEGDYSGWYKLSQGDLNDIGVNSGTAAKTDIDGKVSTSKSGKGADADDGYYVFYNEENATVDVAYEKGVVKDDIIYHKLSEFPE